MYTYEVAEIYIKMSQREVASTEILAGKQKYIFHPSPRLMYVFRKNTLGDNCIPVSKDTYHYAESCSDLREHQDEHQ